MLLPDVTALLTDPSLGGGVPFTVCRRLFRRVHGSVRPEQTETFTERGNLQPAQPTELQQLADEDKQSEVLVIRSTFAFQTGSDAGQTFTAADEVTFGGCCWRVFRVENWSRWGFTVAYATKSAAAAEQEESAHGMA